MHTLRSEMQCTSMNFMLLRGGGEIFEKFYKFDESAWTFCSPDLILRRRKLYRPITHILNFKYDHDIKIKNNYNMEISST
jgi:hypothetical protein